MPSARSTKRSPRGEVREVRTSPLGERFVLLADGTKLKLSRSRRDKLQVLMGR